MKKKKNNDLKVPNIKKLSVIFLIILIILIFFSYNIFKLIKHPTNSFIVEKGKLYLEETAIGYVIREEEVLTGKNSSNGIVQIKAEGEKAAKDEPIFRYYSNNEEKLKKNIEELDLKIQEALAGQTEIYSSDIKILEKQIEEKLNKLNYLNNTQEIEELRKDINNDIIKKAKIAGDLSPSGSYLKNLINERSQYEQQLNSGSEYIKANTGGIVSYRIDGLEQDFTLGDYSNLNKEYLESLNLKVGQTLATSQTSGKVINNFECCIATILESNEAKEAKIGDTVSLRISDCDEITGKIEYISTQEDNSTLIVFHINKNVEKLISCRKISMNVIWWSDSGLKVPNSAIIQEDDKSYIVRNRAGYTDKILIKVLRKNENYAIIDNYSMEELEEMGYTKEEIKAMKSISQHDEILLNSNT